MLEHKKYNLNCSLKGMTVTEIAFYRDLELTIIFKWFKHFVFERTVTQYTERRVCKRDFQRIIDYQTRALMYAESDLRFDLSNSRN